MTVIAESHAPGRVPGRALRRAPRRTLCVNPFVSFLTDHRPGRRDVAGLFDGLTGSCFEIHPRLADMLRRGALEEAPEDATNLLIEARALVETASPEDLLGHYARYRLFIPDHNPAVISFSGNGARVRRLRDAGRCDLPRTADAPECVKETLNEDAGAALRAAAGGSLVRDLVALLNGDAARALAALRILAAPERQLVRAAPPQADGADARRHYLMQSFHWRGDARPADDHYRDGGIDAAWNFDWMEPTCSHAFRAPTAALRGRAYGESFLDGLVAATGWRGEGTVIEVGGGAGWFARAFITRAQARFGAGAPFAYHILDASPYCLEAQGVRLASVGRPVTRHLGDAQQGFPEGLYADVIIANEVIADFNVADSPDGAPVQKGAHAFIEHCRATLRPGGAAVLVEYGGLGATPRLVEHLGHEEYSVDFGDLAATARRLGLETRIVPLHDFLDVDFSASLLIAQQERMLCLREALAEQGETIDFRVYDEDEFNARYGAIWRARAMAPLPFAPAARGGYFGPDVRQFLALIVKAPA